MTRSDAPRCNRPRDATGRPMRHDRPCPKCDAPSLKSSEAAYLMRPSMTPSKPAESRTFPVALHVTEDVCNTLRFTDSGVEIEDFSTLTDGPETGDTNEIAAVYGGSDGRESRSLAHEIARRWNAYPALLAFVERVARVTETPHGNTLRHDWSEEARALLAREGRPA